MYSLRFCSVLFFSQPAHPSCLQIHCIIYFFSGSAAQLLSCHRWCRAPGKCMRYLVVNFPLRVDLPRQHLPFGISRWRCGCRRCSLTKGYWIHMDTGAAVAANGAKPANRNTNTNTKHKQSPTPIRAANGNGNSSSGWGRGRGRTGAATETLEMFLGLSVLVRLRARPANLLNGAKFFSISISISSCRLLTFCGCYSSCFCRCRSCYCCCVCVLPAVVVCVVRVAKYLHSNSIGCVLCLLPFARCCQN